MFVMQAIILLLVWCLSWLMTAFLVLSFWDWGLLYWSWVLFCPTGTGLELGWVLSYWDWARAGLGLG